ncbi:DNA-dependent protein kinase catalytic subunit, partial [Armadillidium nasatum]
MTALYLRVFKAILTLSCDTDNVTRQLFLTLTFQIIHWFTNNKSFEHPDTAALLQVIMDCIVTPNDPSLRDLSAECLFEFMKWSRKQSRSPDQAKFNIKSVLKRIISLCNHPSAFKRLGGCLAWNSIYREVREDEMACDEWIVILLTTFISCLNCCQNDDDLIGTKDQCENAVDHLERIFIVRSKIFNK